MVLLPVPILIIFHLYLKQFRLTLNFWYQFPNFTKQFLSRLAGFASKNFIWKRGLSKWVTFSLVTVDRNGTTIQLNPIKCHLSIAALTSVPMLTQFTHLFSLVPHLHTISPFSLILTHLNRCQGNYLVLCIHFSYQFFFLTSAWCSAINSLIFSSALWIGCELFDAKFRLCARFCLWVAFSFCVENIVCIRYELPQCLAEGKTSHGSESVSNVDHVVCADIRAIRYGSCRTAFLLLFFSPAYASAVQSCLTQRANWIRCQRGLAHEDTDKRQSGELYIQKTPVAHLNVQASHVYLNVIYFEHSIVFSRILFVRYANRTRVRLASVPDWI